MPRLDGWARAGRQVDLASGSTNGEWLRRQARRAEARTQLRAAYDMFFAIGMEAFAERARRELQATGETVRKRSAEAAAHDELTAQERQIAPMALEGLKIN